MKLLTFYSDSHQKMYNDYFLISFNEHLKDSFELNPKKIEQISKSGDYGSDGFSHTMVEKINHIIDNIDVNDSEPLVFSDCDVQFFNDFSNEVIVELDDKDIKFQSDITCLCAGFFFAKQNSTTLNFFKDVKKLLLTVVDKKVDDQQVINHIIKQYPINWGTLSNKYYTIAMSTGPRQWNGEDFNLSFNINAHHANWTLGIDNKYKLMDKVKKKVKKNVDQKVQ